MARRWRNPFGDLGWAPLADLGTKPNRARRGDPAPGGLKDGGAILWLAWTPGSSDGDTQWLVSSAVLNDKRFRKRLEEFEAQLPDGDSF